MSRFHWLILVGILIASAPASAQDSTRTARVVGWTGTGQEIVVETEVQGQVMVDGAATDFYFEATEVYRAKNGGLIRRYQRGEPTGHAHTDFVGAKSEAALKTYLENIGLLTSTSASESPDGRWLITSFDRSKTHEENKRFRCEVEHKSVLLDTETRQVFVIRDGIIRGERSANPRDASCPKLSKRIHWHPGSTDWVIEESIERATHTDWGLVPGQITALGAFPEAPFQTSDYAAQIFNSLTEDAGVKAAWSAAFRGETARAKSALTDSESSSAERVMLLSLIFAMEGQAKVAIKTARAAYKKSPKDPYHRALLGAVYIAAGKSKRGQKEIASALKKAESYDEKLRLGTLFTLVDLGVANQLLVHALSSPEDDNQRTTGYVILAHSLIDALQFNAALDLLSKVKEDEKSTEIRLAEARLASQQGRMKDAVAVEEILFREPGQCLAYNIYARAIAPTRPAEALDHFRAAARCDDTDIDSIFFLAGLELEAGRLERAKELYQAFLTRAVERREDDIREARREMATDFSKRLDHDGAVLTPVTCRRLGSARLCQGVVYNTSDAVLEDVEVIVSKSGKRDKELARSKVEAIPPGESRAFGIRVETDANSLAVSAGRNAQEFTVNRTPAR